MFIHTLERKGGGGGGQSEYTHCQVYKELLGVFVVDNLMFNGLYY